MSLFRSFWIAGFECSCQINSAGKRLDMTAAIQHDELALDDYRMIRQAGMSTARDGLRWHRIDRAGQYDWSTWTPMLEDARTAGVQVIWDLCHYGWPDDLDIFSPAFVDRFARFTAEAARIHREHTGDIPFFVPVNEINFFTWGATRPLIFPYASRKDGELKRQLVRASIAAIEAIWAVDPRARFVFAEPLIHTVPPRRRPQIKAPAQRQRDSQFEAFDMIAGRTSPELGGQERYLDVVGLNYYSANQWEVPGGRKLHWDAGSNDPRWMPLHKLLQEVWERYGRPMFLAETSHYGTGRAAWIEEVAREISQAMRNGVPFEGICLYPILDRYDWEDCRHWHNSGLWDLNLDGTGRYQRVINEEYAHAVRQAQRVLF